MLAVSDQQAWRPGEGAPFRIGGDIEAPELLEHVPPTYPESARQAGIEGVVILEARVARDGSVEDVNLLQGVDAELDRAARQAVEQWRYTTTFYEGTPVPVLVTASVTFRLQDDGR